MTRRIDRLARPRQGRLAAGLFNYTWSLIEKKRRTHAEDELMVNAAHASMYHWTAIRGGDPAVGWWQISRVYSLVKRPAQARHYARLCLRHCIRNRLGDWRLAFTYEALARAAVAAGNRPGARQFLARAVAQGARIKDAEDRAHFEKSLHTVPGFDRLAHPNRKSRRSGPSY